VADYEDMSDYEERRLTKVREKILNMTDKQFDRLIELMFSDEELNEEEDRGES